MIKLKTAAFAGLLAWTCALGAQPLTGEMAVHEKSGVECTACHQGALTEPASQSACLACHGSYADVAARTAAIVPNPHASHMGELDCRVCHSAHKTSRVWCNDCHTFESLKLGQ